MLILISDPTVDFLISQVRARLSKFLEYIKWENMSGDENIDWSESLKKNSLNTSLAEGTKGTKGKEDFIVRVYFRLMIGWN